MSNQVSFTVTQDWDPQNTLEEVTPTFSLDLLNKSEYKQVLHPAGCGVVIVLVTGNDERDGVYLGDVQDWDVFANTFTVELM
jgi:hypothetical protein